MRLSPHTAQHLWSFSIDIHEASVPISPAPQYIPRGQLARSLGSFVPIFPKARGLRHHSSSCCAQLSWAPTTPTVCLDVISLVASSCGYDRAQIEPRVAH